MGKYIIAVIFAVLIWFPQVSWGGAVPIPPAERSLKTIVAEPWFEVSPQNHVLEGAIFDPDGNLLFCDVTAKKVMRLTPEKKLATVVELSDMSPGGLGLRKDGALLIAAMRPELDKGAIWKLTADGKLEAVIPESAGYAPNDLALAPDGSFYFSDFRGKADSPAGGIYYVSPDYKTIKPVISHLAQGNGVALSPDGKTLWAGEFAKNRLHMAELADAATIQPTGSYVPYYFTGPAPDSMRVDKEGNVYVAIYRQGRVLVFNKNGLPVAQILLPGRDEGKNLLSTSLAMNPENGDMLIVTSNTLDEEGARIFRAKAEAPGLPPLNHKK